MYTLASPNVANLTRTCWEGTHEQQKLDFVSPPFFFPFPSLHKIPLFYYPSYYSCQNTQSHTCWRQCPDVSLQLFSCGINIFLCSSFRFMQLFSQPVDMLFCRRGMHWCKQHCSLTCVHVCNIYYILHTITSPH